MTGEVISKRPMKAKRSVFATISREFGCDGFLTGSILSDIIKSKYPNAPWEVYTHPVMESMVGDEKLGAKVIDKVSEERYTFASWFLDGIVPENLASPQSQAFHRMQNLILNLAQKGNCILMGGGSQIITNRLSPKKFAGFHFRIVAPYEFRVKSVMNRFSMEQGEAENFLDRKQSARDKFVEDFTGRSPMEDSLYHLTMNNSLMGPKVMAEMMFGYLDLRGAFDI